MSFLRICSWLFDLMCIEVDWSMTSMTSNLLSLEVLTRRRTIQISAEDRLIENDLLHGLVLRVLRVWITSIRVLVVMLISVVFIIIARWVVKQVLHCFLHSWTIIVGKVVRLEHLVASMLLGLYNRLLGMTMIFFLIHLIDRNCIAKTCWHQVRIAVGCLCQSWSIATAMYVCIYLHIIKEAIIYALLMLERWTHELRRILHCILLKLHLFCRWIPWIEVILGGRWGHGHIIFRIQSLLIISYLSSFVSIICLLDLLLKRINCRINWKLWDLFDLVLKTRDIRLSLGSVPINWLTTRKISLLECKCRHIVLIIRLCLNALLMVLSQILMILTRAVRRLHSTLMIVDLRTTVKVFVAHWARVKTKRLLISFLLIIIVLMWFLHHYYFIFFNHLSEELSEDFLRAYIESFAPILVQSYEFNAVIFWHDVFLHEFILRTAV